MENHSLFRHDDALRRIKVSPSSFVGDSRLPLESIVLYGWPDGEQNITVFRGLKSDFENALDFWFAVLHSNKLVSLDYVIGFIEQCSDTFLNEDGLAKLVLDSFGDYGKANIFVPWNMLGRNDFESAIKLCDNVDSLILLAQYKNDYIVFSWENGA